MKSYLRLKIEKILNTDCGHFWIDKRKVGYRLKFSGIAYNTVTTTQIQQIQQLSHVLKVGQNKHYMFFNKLQGGGLLCIWIDNKLRLIKD